MTNDLIPYRPQGGEMSFQGQKVRHVVLGDDPWFVAKDVCVILSIGQRSDGSFNTTHGLRKLSPDEKGVHPIHSLGGLQRTAVISESGLYKLIMRSDKPVARAFQDWVTRTVIPSIRKTGGYLLNEEARAVAAVDPTMPTTMAEAIRKQAEALALYADEVERSARRDSANLRTTVPKPYPIFAITPGLRTTWWIAAQAQDAGGWGIVQTYRQPCPVVVAHWGHPKHKHDWSEGRPAKVPIAI